MYSLKISIQEKYNIKFVHKGVIVQNWAYFYKYFDLFWFYPLKYEWIFFFCIQFGSISKVNYLDRDKTCSCSRRIASEELHALPLKILCSRCFLQISY